MKTTIKLALALTLTIGCKPGKQASETQSLDDFVDQTHGDVAQDNDCGMAFTSLVKLPAHIQKLDKTDFIDAKGTLRNEVLGTLATIPPALLAPLAMAKGRIVVSSSMDAARDACDGALGSAEEKQLAKGKTVTTCWTDKPVRIMLPPDPKLIRHGLLKAATYFYTEYFVGRASMAAAPFNDAKWKKEISGFKDVRDGLMEAFLVDTELKDPKAVASMRKALTSEQLANYVYAESLDSYYCKSSSKPGTPRAAFRSRFPATWKVFTDSSNANSPVNLFGR